MAVHYIVLLIYTQLQNQKKCCSSMLDAFCFWMAAASSLLFVSQELLQEL